VNRTINTAAAQQRIIGGINDGIYRKPGDVLNNDVDLRHFVSC
jgi:hypothetical protein